MLGSRMWHQNSSTGQWRPPGRHDRQTAPRIQRRRQGRDMNPLSAFESTPPSSSTLPRLLHLLSPRTLLPYVDSTQTMTMADESTLDTIRKRLLETGDWDR